MIGLHPRSNIEMSPSASVDEPLFYALSLLHIFCSGAWLEVRWLQPRRTVPVCGFGELELSAAALASLNCQRHHHTSVVPLLCLEVRRSWQPGSPPMVKHASCMLRSPCCLWPKPKVDFYAWLEHSSMRCLEPWS